MTQHQGKIYFWNHEETWGILEKIKRAGAPVMTGNKTDLMGTIREEMDKRNPEVYTELHCVIHKQSLCGRTLKSNMLWKLRYRLWTPVDISAWSSLVLITFCRWLMLGRIKLFWRQLENANLFRPPYFGLLSKSPCCWNDRYWPCLE